MFVNICRFSLTHFWVHYSIHPSAHNLFSWRQAEPFFSFVSEFFVYAELFELRTGSSDSCGGGTARVEDEVLMGIETARKF